MEDRLINIIERAISNGGRVVIDHSPVKFPDSNTYEYAYNISGCGLGGAYKRTLVEAVSDWAQSLVWLSNHDPEHYERFKELLND